MMIPPWRVVIGIVAIIFLHHSAWAEVSAANIDGINRTIMEIFRQIKTLQHEVQQLRGEVELYAHTLNALKDREPEEVPEQRMATITAPIPVPAGAPVVDPPFAPQPPRQLAAVKLVDSNTDQQGAYDKAFSLLRSGSYDEAIKGFRDFLASYSEGEFAANSQYWIGEAYYVTRRFKEAMPEFQRMVSNHSNSAKTGDALLKIGYIQYELNQMAEAKKSLEEIITRFPQSTAAKLAATRLAKMQR